MTVIEEKRSSCCSGPAVGGEIRDYSELAFHTVAVERQYRNMNLETDPGTAESRTPSFKRQKYKVGLV